MDIKQRYLDTCIAADLKKKMVFLGGPRQVGKTTSALNIGESNYHNVSYLNWDDRDDQKNIIARTFGAETDLIIFDELHKYQKWKNYIKGLYDKQQKNFHILVTGSARLDLYRRGGDSLMGRYHYYRLHPFSVAELMQTKNRFTIHAALTFPKQKNGRKNLYTNLLRFSGFPEPLFNQNERTHRRWQKERLERLLREDVRDVEYIKQISSLEILTQLLPDKVGSVFSLNSLQEDLQVSYNTMARWVDILENFYYHFRIRPWTNTKIRSLKKEPKLYLWDWTEVNDHGARLENLVASHLLKFVHFLEDTEGYRIELQYLRDRDGREVDFIVTVDNKPWFAVEVKNHTITPSKHLFYFCE